MPLYNTILEIYANHPYLWSGLPTGWVFLLLLPLLISFGWTLAQQCSDQNWRYHDRANGLEFALNQIRPQSTTLRYFNRYFAIIFLIELIFFAFALVHGKPIVAVISPLKALLWGFAFSLKLFIKRIKWAIQDKIRGEMVGWVKQEFNTILSTCSDFFVLNFISERPNCQAFFDKIFIFPEAKPGSLTIPELGPLFSDPFHLNGVALVDDSSLFMFDGKDSVIVHVKSTLRNLLKMQYKPELAEKDEGLLEIIAALPYSLLQQKMVQTRWDCVRQVIGEEEDSLEQYEREPFDDATFEKYMPYMKGIFSLNIPRIELFPEYVTKIVSTGTSVELFWHSTAGAPTWIPHYPRAAGVSITDQLQDLVRKHRRAKLADAPITERLNAPTAISASTPEEPATDTLVEMPEIPQT